MPALILLFLCLTACGQAPLDQDAPALPTPVADRELWGVRLELYQPGLRVEVEVPYLRDDEEAQTSWADSGAQVVFFDSAGGLSSRISAGRLSLERGAGRLSLGGEVVVSAPDSLEVRADTLVWDRQIARLAIPGPVRLSTSSGLEEGDSLEAGLGFESWAMRRVRGQWTGGGYQVEIRAQRETGQRQGESFLVQYDSAAIHWEGSRITSPLATFSSGAGRVSFSGGVTSADSLRTFQAAEMEYLLEERQVAARGQVRLEEPGLRLEAQALREDQGAGRWQAWGEPALPATINREQYSIQAEQFTYLKEADALEAVGRVIFRDGERVLEAGLLRYWHRERRLEARDRVSFAAPEFEGLATAGELAYDLEAEQGQLRGAPRVQRRDGEALLLSAGELDFDLKNKELTGREGFAVEGRTTRLSARQGVFRSGREELTLAGQVELRRQSTQRHTWLRTDSLVVELEEGRIARLSAPAALSGNFATPPDQVGWFQAHSGAAAFAGDELERLELEGEADLTRQQRGETSRLQGRQLLLHFAGGDLRRVEAEGGARMWARLPGALNHVKGEHLELLVGEQDTLRVARSEGTYYQEGQGVPAH